VPGDGEAELSSHVFFPCRRLVEGDGANPEGLNFFSATLYSSHR
jgi:hypothetical protein